MEAKTIYCINCNAQMDYALYNEIYNDVVAQFKNNELSEIEERKNENNELARIYDLAKIHDLEENYELSKIDNLEKDILRQHGPSEPLCSECLLKKRDAIIECEKIREKIAEVKHEICKHKSVMEKVRKHYGNDFGRVMEGKAAIRKYKILKQNLITLRSRIKEIQY